MMNTLFSYTSKNIVFKSGIIFFVYDERSEHSQVFECPSEIGEVQLSLRLMKLRCFWQQMTWSNHIRVGKTIKYDFTLFVAGVAGEKGSFDSIFNLNILFMQSSFRGQLNLLTPNDPYMGRTAPLASKHCILCIYSTNIGTEYFKHALYSPFFFLFKMQFVS